MEGVKYRKYLYSKLTVFIPYSELGFTRHTVRLLYAINNYLFRYEMLPKSKFNIEL